MKERHDIDKIETEFASKNFFTDNFIIDVFVFIIAIILVISTILGKSKMDSASECLLVLHWLPIHSRIQNKILTLVCKCIKGSAPEYLQNLLVVHRPSRPGLRSMLDTNLLVVPFVRWKTFAECSFSVQGPKMWNSLLEVLRSETDTDVLKGN